MVRGDSGRCISIHTPAKGVTYGDEAACLIVNISIHTPAKGVTLNSASAFDI